MYPITSPYMARESFRSHGHLGIDFQMPRLTPLRSIQEGVIEKIVDYKDKNVGKAVFVKWEDGKTAIYGHMHSISCRTGQKVEVGSLLGYSGNSGHVVGKNGGYHLHFGLKSPDGSFLDPSPYIDHIQNMNNIEKLRYICGIGKDIVKELPAKLPDDSYVSFFELVEKQMNIYEEIGKMLKANFAHVLSLIDNSMFIQYLQYFFQLFS